MPAGGSRASHQAQAPERGPCEPAQVTGRDAGPHHQELLQSWTQSFPKSGQPCDSSVRVSEPEGTRTRAARKRPPPPPSQHPPWRSSPASSGEGNRKVLLRQRPHPAPPWDTPGSLWQPPCPDPGWGAAADGNGVSLRMTKKSWSPRMAAAARPRECAARHRPAHLEVVNFTLHEFDKKLEKLND